MIDKKIVEDVVLDAIRGTQLFMVDVTVSPDNRIVVEIDAATGGVDIDDCIALNRRIEEALDRDKEDFELEVGSAGLTSPFKVKEQYIKNIGNDVEVLTRDGRKLRGRLEEVADDTFTIVTTVKERVEGKKRPEMVEHPVTIPYDQAKQVVYLIDFK